MTNNLSSGAEEMRNSMNAELNECKTAEKKCETE